MVCTFLHAELPGFSQQRKNVQFQPKSENKCFYRGKNRNQQFNLIDYIVKPLTPLLRVLGLDKKLGMLWLTAVIFGLLYGAAVIVEEAKKGNFTREELQRLQVSIGINHSMLEDPALFLSLGLSPFWLWVPRIVAAIVAVHGLNQYHRIKAASGSAPVSPEPPKTNTLSG